MTNMLKKYDKHINKKMEGEGTIPSGVQSGDTDNELLVMTPLKEHPEIKGLYRAIDPVTKWRGWVEYEPPKPEPKPEPKIDPKEAKKHEFNLLTTEYRQKKGLVDLGLFTDEELGLGAMKVQIKSLYDEIK